MAWAVSGSAGGCVVVSVGSLEDSASSTGDGVVASDVSAALVVVAAVESAESEGSSFRATPQKTMSPARTAATSPASSQSARPRRRPDSRGGPSPVRSGSAGAGATGAATTGAAAEDPAGAGPAGADASCGAGEVRVGRGGTGVGGFAGIGVTGCASPSAGADLVPSGPVPAGNAVVRARPGAPDRRSVRARST